LSIFPISQKSCRFFRTENSTGSYCRSGDIFPFTAIPITWSARHLNAILRSDVQTHVCHLSYLALRAGPPLYAIIYKKRHIGILATFIQVAYTSSRHPPHHVPSQESRIWTQEASFNATFPSHDRNGVRQRPQLSFQDRCPNGDVGTSSHEPHCVRLCLQCNSIAQLDGSAMMLRM
jgi:hypothetical protein